MRLGVLSFLAGILCLAAGCEKQEAAGSGFSAHGRLKVEGTALVDEHGDPTVLRGMSSHGVCWYPRYLNGGAMKTLAEHGANLFRIAVYTEPAGAYLEDPERSLDYLYMGMESALSADLYVIVDWHILKDETPLLYADEAEGFFDTVSARYGDMPGVIYEICNEPNGDTTWEDIRAYAERIIPVIRLNAPNALILVGTPDYCTDFTGPLEDPLEFTNIMYSMHRYVDISSEKPCGPSQLTKLIAAGLPVFVTEWGVSLEEQAAFSEEDFSAQIPAFPEAAQPFIDEMNEYGISWAGWSLSNKEECHSAILPECQKLSSWTEDDLSISGKLMFSNFAP